MPGLDTTSPASPLTTAQPEPTGRINTIRRWAPRLGHLGVWRPPDEAWEFLRWCLRLHIMQLALRLQTPLQASNCAPFLVVHQKNRNLPTLPGENAVSAMASCEILTHRVLIKPVFRLVEFIFGNLRSLFPNQHWPLVGQRRNRPKSKPVPRSASLYGKDVGIQIDKRTRFRAATSSEERMDSAQHTGIERVANSCDDFGR